MSGSVTLPDEIRPHYPALDGLRGIAVIGVVACHLSFRPLVFGWMGVPLFFVLSGFLITGILMRSRERADYFRRFYWRRALRIFPIYYLYVAGSLLIGVLAAMPIADLGWSALYVQNYRVPGATWLVPPFFGGHTWSLAVEEQFYLLWPFTVWLLSTRALGWVSVLLILAGLLFRFWAHVVTQDPSRWIVYGWLPSNIDCLAAGAFVAVLHHENWLHRRWAGAVAAVAGALLVALVWQTSLDDWQSSDLWLAPRINVLLNSALAVSSAGLVGYCALVPIRFLSVNPLKHVGRISYGLYLWHVPAFWCVSRFLPLDGHIYLTAFIKVIASYLIAWLSWTLLESKLLGRPFPGSTKPQTGMAFSE